MLPSHFSNRITQDGAKELAKLIKRDTTLRVLDLGFNRIQDDGAIHLAESLSAFNTHLTTYVTGSCFERHPHLGGTSYSLIVAGIEHF